MDDFVVKPVRLEEFQAALERWGRAKAGCPTSPGNPAGASAATEECLDPNFIKDIRELEDAGEPGFLAKLINSYLTDSPEKLACLKNAVEMGDCQAAAPLAHNLRGSSGLFGALRLAKLLTELETASRSDDAAAAAAVIEQVGAEFDRVRHALAHIIPGEHHDTMRFVRSRMPIPRSLSGPQRSFRPA
jgi:HPt (histidine-containing phosphotransfer) domain-containing protein